MASDQQNPFLAADDVDAGMERFADLWRLQVICCAVLSVCILILVGGLIAAGQGAPIQTYLIGTDLVGAPIVVTPAASVSKQDPRVIEATLSTWIHNVRGVSTDAEVQKERYLQAAAFVARDVRTWLNRWLSEPENSARLIREETRRNIEVYNVLRRNDKTWELRWREIEVRRNGESTRRNFTGLVSVGFQEHRTAQGVMVNPLGLFITQFTYDETRGVFEQ